MELVFHASIVIKFEILGGYLRLTDNALIFGAGYKGCEYMTVNIPYCDIFKVYKTKICFVVELNNNLKYRFITLRRKRVIALIQDKIL